MMEDRELLELAARAAGVKLAWRKTPVIFDMPIFSEEPYIYDPASDRAWNPLTNDGDALRLAVSLNMLIEVAGYIARVVVSFNGVDHEIFHTCEQPTEATRRAIVRAAAEAGKAMK